MHRVVHNMEGKQKYLHLMAKGRSAEHSEVEQYSLGAKQIAAAV